MAFSYLTEDNLFDRWKDSKRYTDDLTQPFEEFERIARNEPTPGIDENYPNVTDGTTASIIQKTPKRVVQQVPTGVVEGDEADEALCLIAGFIYQNKILPYANEDYDLFEKAQLIIESGLTFGSGLSYCPFLNHNGTFGPDLTLPYWGDIYLQPGKRSGRSCNYIFIRTWWQKEDVEALIDGESKAAAQAKKRGEEYQPTWDVSALRSIKSAQDSKDQQAQTPSEDQRGANAQGIEIVTGFQEGVGATFYTFNPGSKTIVRRKKNKDPRGKMPLDWFYGDLDGSNPFGRGIVELLGGLQNLIDSDMQAYQYNRALALQPPVLKVGNIPSNFLYQPNWVGESTDPNAKLVPLTVDTAALTNYPQLYGMQKSQLLNLVSSPDTSISADVGNPGFSKTPAGINQQKAAISVDDNSIRKQFEAWFESWSETAINTYFAERSGIETIDLDKETADKLRKLAEGGKFDASQLNDQDQVLIDFDTATPVLKFRVDASTSKMSDDQAQLAGIDAMAQLLNQSPDLSQIMLQMYPDKVLSLWNRAVSVTGLEDAEELKVDIGEFKQQQAQMQAQASQAAQAQQVEEPPLVSHLRQLGVSNEGIGQVVQHVLSQPGIAQ